MDFTETKKPGPPDFENARNKRQKVRAAGMDPNHWYAVEHVDALAPGDVTEVTFWRKSVALFRDEWGTLHAVENRCAHRQLKLSLGLVEKDRIVCPYHGWQYDGEGRLVSVAHELFGKKLPKCKVKSYAVRERYGLIWLFFGDPAMAFDVAMPEIPELEQEKPWACIPLDFTIKAHHSMIIDNVSDFTHAFLHRKYKPFWDAKLVEMKEEENRVLVSYDTVIGGGGATKYFVDRNNIDTNSIKLGYEYPYQWSNTDGQIKHWLSVLPIDERTTKAFFIFYFKSFKVPFLPLRFPHRLMKTVLRAANEVQIKPVMAEDIMACEAEQRGYEEHYDEPIAEINPAVHAFQALTIRKWEEYLEREAAKKRVKLRRGATDAAE